MRTEPEVYRKGNGLVFRPNGARRLLVLASNLYSLTDSGLGFLEGLVKDGGFETEIIGSSYGLSHAREAQIRSKLIAAGAGQVSIIRDYPDPNCSILWRRASRYWRILVEFSFWFAWFRKRDYTRFDLVLQQTENSFSDLLASRILSRGAAGQIFTWTTFPPIEETLNPNFSMPKRSWRRPTISTARLFKFHVARLLDLVTYNWPQSFALTLIETMADCHERNSGGREARLPRIYVTNSIYTSAVLKERLPQSSVSVGFFSHQQPEASDIAPRKTLGILMGAYISDGILSIRDYLRSLERAISFFQEHHGISEVLLRAHPRYVGEAREVVDALSDSGAPVALVTEEMELCGFAQSCGFVLAGYTAALLPISETIGKGRTLLFEHWFSADRVPLHNFGDYSVFRLTPTGGEVSFSQARLPEKSASSIMLEWFVDVEQRNPRS
jgi:hypothetical protein